MDRSRLLLYAFLLGCVVFCLCLPGSSALIAYSTNDILSVSSMNSDAYAAEVQQHNNDISTTQFYQLTSGLRPGRGGPIPAASTIQDELPVTDISFYNFRGYRISGWLAMSAPHAPVVILLHGTPGNRMSMLSRATFLYQHGYNVLLFDFQSYGNSDGIISTLGMVESEDILAAIDYVHSRSDTFDSKVGLLGLSMGATASILAAARSDDIVAVVAESCPVDATLVTGDVPSDEARLADTELVEQVYGVDITQARPIDAIGQLSEHNTAVFLINGDSDSVTPLAGMYDLYQNAGSPRQFWVVPGAEHAQSFDIDTTGYEQQVDAFFDAYFS